VRREIVQGFVGRFEHTLDDKGRLSLPARYRASFPGTALLSHYYEGCVAIWTEAEFDRQMREMQALHRSGTTKGRNRARMWSEGVSEVDVDKQGRLVLPSKSRTFADLAGEICILGQVDHLEVWNPVRHDGQVLPEAPYFLGDDLDS
jgi:MraZ protein